MAFLTFVLTTTVLSIQYTIQLLVTLVHSKPESEDSWSVIIGVMDEKCCIVCSESFENDLDPAIQYPTDLTCTSVTNNWIVYQTEGAVVLKKPHEPIDTPPCVWAARTKRYACGNF